MDFFEPTTPDSSIARKLKESRPRVAHVAWGVDGIDQVFDKLRANGNRLSGESLVLVRSGYKTLTIATTDSHRILFQLEEGEES